MSSLAPLSTHIFAFIRDESNNRMPVSSRLEFCVNNECLATFVSKNYDFGLYDLYGVFGSSFLVFAGQRLLKLLNRHFNYVLHQPIDRADRFDISTYDFCEMLRAVYWNGTDWRCESITTELAHWLDQDKPIDPILLNFIVSPTGERRVY